MYGNGPQLPLNVSCQLMPPMRGPERFSFGPSFWNDQDDNEWKSEADDSDNPTSRQHSLQARDYQNVMKQRGSRKTKLMKSG